MSNNRTLTPKKMVSSISENTSLNKMDKCISPRINSYAVPIFVASKGAIFCSVKYQGEFKLYLLGMALASRMILDKFRRFLTFGRVAR